MTTSEKESQNEIFNVGNWIVYASSATLQTSNPFARLVKLRAVARTEFVPHEEKIGAHEVQLSRSMATIETQVAYNFQIRKANRTLSDLLGTEDGTPNSSDAAFEAALHKYLCSLGSQLSIHEILPVVSESNALMGVASLREVHRQGLRHRETYTYIIRNNEVLLQLRKDTNQWDHSSAGHNGVYELPIETAQRETKEECGIVLPRGKLEQIASVHLSTTRNNRINNRIAYLFVAQVDTPLDQLKPQANEVLGFKYVGRKELEQIITDPASNLTSTAKQMLKEHVLPYMMR